MMTMLDWKKWQVAATVVALTMGFLLVAQFKTTLEVQKGRVDVAERQRSLQSLLDKAQQDQELLKKEAAALKLELNKYEEAAKGMGELPRGMSEEVDRLRLLTGYSDAEGPGIIITLDDRQAIGTEVNIIDLMEIVNILRYGGAEAIAVNGQRIIAQSEIYVSGKNILVNKTPINNGSANPYTIEAIGNTDRLMQYVQVTDGLILSLKAKKVDVKIVKQPKISIPSYSGGFKFRLGKPVIGNVKQAAGGGKLSQFH